MFLVFCELFGVCVYCGCWFGLLLGFGDKRGDCLFICFDEFWFGDLLFFCVVFGGDGDRLVILERGEVWRVVELVCLCWYGSSCLRIGL